MPFDWTQGSAPPDVKIKQAQSTTAPGFYTDYLKKLGSTGEALLGAEAPKYAGEQELQTTAFDEAKNRMFGGQGFMDTASRFGQAAGATTAQQLQGYEYIDPVTGEKSTMGGGYMNPYIKDVVSEINRLGQRQMQEAMPGIGGLGVGTGGFGGKRGLQQEGIAKRQALADILGQQSGALSQGYDMASKLAAGDLGRYMQGAQTMGGLGQIQSGMNIAELQNLASLGAQQQAIAQGEENFPLQTAQAVSGLMRGYTMPTDTSSTYEGPLAGLQYSPSGLQQLSTLAGLFAPTGSAGTGASAVEGLIKAGKGAFDVIKGLFPTSYTYDGTGNSGTGGDGGFTG
jgi:hypothetical protein